MSAKKSNTKSRFIWWIAYGAVLLLPVIIRIVVTIEHVHQPLFSFLRIDEVEYERWAKIVTQGSFFHDFVPIHSPGYPWFLGTAYKIFGYHLLIPRILQICLGLGSIILVQRITKKIFNEAASFASAIIFGLYWPLIIFEQRILDISLFLFLNMLSLLLVLKAVESTNAKSSKSLFIWIVAGFSIGTAVIVRPTALAWLLGIILWLIIRTILQRSRPLIIYSVSFLLAASLVIAPMIIKNHSISGQWFLFQSNTSLNLYQGNNPDADGTPYARIGQAWDNLESIPLKEKGITNPYEQERYYKNKVIEFIKKDPASFAWLQVKKIGLLLNRKEIRATIDPEFHRHLFRGLLIPLPGFGLIFGLACAGILIIRLSRSDHQLLLIYLLTHAATVLAVLISSRYRMPFTAGLIILSGAGLMLIIQSLFRSLSSYLGTSGVSIPQTASHFRRVVPLLVFIAGLSIAALPIAPKHTDAEELTYLGQAWRIAGNEQQALTCFKEALKQEPNYGNALVQIARIDRNRGLSDSAIQSLKQAEASEPKSSIVHYDLGVTLWQMGRKEEAIKQMYVAVECRPMWIHALKALAVFEWETGSAEKARKHLETILSLEPNEKDALTLLQKMNSNR